MPFKVPLFEHQAKALEKMHNGCILVGGVGSGKSRTSLAYYVCHVLGITKVHKKLGEYGEVKEFYVMPDYKDLKETKKLYVITTARKRDTNDWFAEAIPFGITTEFSKVEIVVDSWNNIKKYENIKDAYFIFDEQRVVGYGAWVKSFLKISKGNGWILLSATPGDTWSDYIPVFIANGFYKNKTEFNSRHAVFARFSKYPKIERYVELSRLNRCRSQVLVEMKCHRDTVQHHSDVRCGYDKETYKRIFKDRWNPFEDKPIVDAGECCLLLRRLVNTDADRVRKLKVLLTDHPKSIVFYNFNCELELLRQICEEIGMPYTEWNGHKHEEVLQGDQWAYLCQYNAASEAWQCTATDTIIFYSANYSYKIMIQSAGRIDRMNTPFKDLYYYHLTSLSPIDRSIQYAIKRKKNFNESKFIVW